MNSYDFHIKASNAARAGYEKRTPQSGSFNAFRKFARAINTSLVEERKQLEAQRKDIGKTYAPQLAKEKIAELDSVFSTLADTKKNTLREVLSRLMTSKREAINAYTMTPPTQAQLRLIDSISRRIDSLSDTEWNMVIAEVSGNYQASALVKEIAGKADRSYTMPFNPEEFLSQLDSLGDKLNKIIDGIDKDPLEIGYLAAEFLSESEVGVLPALCAEFDESAPSYTAESILEMTDMEDLTARLLSARHVAFKNKDNTLFGEIVGTNMKLQENATDMDVAKAEQLIDYVNTLYGAEGK